MQGIKKINIDGQDYEIYNMPLQATTKMLAKLVKMFGPAIGGLVGDDLSIKALDRKINVQSAIVLLAERIEEDSVWAMVMQLLGYVRLGTWAQIQPELQFEGKLMHMLNVVAAVLEHNFGDFFAALSGVTGLFRPKGKDSIPDQSAQNG